MNAEQRTELSVLRARLTELIETARYADSVVVHRHAMNELYFVRLRMQMLHLELAAKDTM